MKKVIITLNEATSRFEAKDIDGKVYYTAARKSDVKTSIKRSKKYQLEIVEEFEVEKPAETKPKTVNHRDVFGEYAQYILDNANGEIRATGEFVAKFCENFGLKLSSKKRNLTFERVLENMVGKGLLDRVPSTGKYKKLIYTLAEEEL